MKQPKRETQLLVSTFTIKNNSGRVCSCSGVDTSQGRLADWLALERRGLVRRTLKSGRGALGHLYGYQLTKTGEEFLKKEIQNQ